jgi:copper chaperone CopZ
MQSRTVTVENISCGHCTHTIEMELGDLVGVQRVKADMDSRQVIVEWDDPATWEKIESLMVEINYAPNA